MRATSYKRANRTARNWLQIRSHQAVEARVTQGQLAPDKSAVKAAAAEFLALHNDYEQGRTPEKKAALHRYLTR